MSKKNEPRNILPPIQLALFSAIAANLVNTIVSNAKFNAALDKPVQEKSDPMMTSTGFFKRSAHKADAINGIVQIQPDVAASIDVEDAAETFVKNNCPYLESELGKRFYITQTIDIGRYSFNDIQINDRTVSGLHCRIYVNDGIYYLIDMGATNPTQLNGRMLKSYKELGDDSFCYNRLSSGDIITIGETDYRFQTPSAARDKVSVAFNKGSSTIIIS